MPSQDILIRAIEPDDFRDIAQIFEQPRAIWGTLQLPFTSVEARQKRFAATPPGHTMLAAVIEGRVIGTAGLHPYDHRRRAHAATIGMAVHDAFAGRGAGRALLGALLTQADRWLNYQRIELTVWSDNDRAIALYEHAGFEREGLLRRYAWRDGAYVDALTMARLRD
jgi:putative acetyltransferase